jgi:hypothetical protein
MKKLYIFSLLMIIFIVGNTYAPEQSKFSVGVDVTCDDENTKVFIESHIKRELRALQDVNIVSYEDAWVLLQIIAIEPTYKTTELKIGTIAIASCWYERNTFAEAVIDLKAGKEAKDLIIGEVYRRPTLSLSTGIAKDLDKLCKDIIVNFDQKCLEANRKAIQEINRKYDLQ